jgi:tryptophanyl-tRNA synthetase
MSIETDSTPLEDPKNPDTCNAFAIYFLLATEENRTMKALTLAEIVTVMPTSV